MMKQWFDKFWGNLKAYSPIILLVLLIAFISFIAGMEAQKTKMRSSLEFDIISNLELMKKEISYVIRRGEKSLSPADISVLRNASANIQHDMRSGLISYKLVRYPNSLLYLRCLNSRLQSTEDISLCVQQYAVLIGNTPLDRETGLYNFMESLETSLSTEEANVFLRELEFGKGIVEEADERSATISDEKAGDRTDE